MRQNFRLWTARIAQTPDLALAPNERLFVSRGLARFPGGGLRGAGTAPGS